MTMPSLYKQVVCFDLDDTLYKECNYLRSAFQEIAAYIDRNCGVSEKTVYSEMISTWDEGKSPFQEICVRHGIGITVEQCLQIYREHHPNISLDDKTSYTLKALLANGCTLGLITDGRSITQRNKIEVLGLHAFFQEEHIVISEESFNAYTVNGNRFLRIGVKNLSHIFKFKNFLHVFLLSALQCACKGY